MKNKQKYQSSKQQIKQKVRLNFFVPRIELKTKICNRPNDCLFLLKIVFYFILDRNL